MWVYLVFTCIEFAIIGTLLPYDDKKSQTLSPQRSPYKVIMANTPTRVDITRSPSLVSIVL